MLVSVNTFRPKIEVPLVPMYLKEYVVEYSETAPGVSFELKEYVVEYAVSEEV